MAQVVAFETDPSVYEIMVDVLQHFGIDHHYCLVPLSSIRPKYFQSVLAEHQPRLILSSWRYIGECVVYAAKGLRPKPQIWLFTSYNPEVLVAQQALFWVDRVFEKPFHVLHLAEEMREMLQGTQEQYSAAPRGSP